RQRYRRRLSGSRPLGAGDGVTRGGVGRGEGRRKAAGSGLRADARRGSPTGGWPQGIGSGELGLLICMQNLEQRVAVVVPSALQQFTHWPWLDSARQSSMVCGPGETLEADLPPEGARAPAPPMRRR